MLVTTKAIVLSALKYGDTSLIVKVFTASDGPKSYLIKGVLSSKKGKLKMAYFQPLSQLELVAVHRNKGTLEHMREARVVYHYRTLHTDFSKNAMVLFLSEILAGSLQEEEPNTDLFQFLEATLQWLDNNNKVANFHLYFLLALSKYLGFFPDTSRIDLPYYDLLEGQFVEKPSGNPLLENEHIKHFKALLGTNFDGIHTIQMDKNIRRELLKSFVLFYELHLQGFRKPRSLAVLHEVFS